MANLTRREFLLSLAAMPALGLRLPQLMTLTPGSGQARQGDPGQPNFIIMVFDTFSARHLPLRGYPRDTTPNISRLAERATVFHNHYAGGNYTTPGTASLLTGLYPWSHRSLHMYGHALESVAPVNLFSQLPDAYQTVAYTQNALASALPPWRLNSILILLEKRKTKPEAIVTITAKTWKSIPPVLGSM